MFPSLPTSRYSKLSQLQIISKRKRNDSTKAQNCKQKSSQKDQFLISLTKGIDKMWGIVVDCALNWKIAIN
jgi:hypothetical protein